MTARKFMELVEREYMKIKKRMSVKMKSVRGHLKMMKMVATIKKIEMKVIIYLIMLERVQNSYKELKFQTYLDIPMKFI